MTLADRIRAHPDLPAREVAKIVGTSPEWVRSLRSRDKHRDRFRARMRSWGERDRRRRGIRAMDDIKLAKADVEARILELRRRNKTYDDIPAILGLTGRGAVAGHISRMRLAGVTVP